MRTFKNNAEKNCYYCLTGAPALAQLREPGETRPVYVVEGHSGIWSGKGTPPAIGSRVRCTINKLGPGTVVGYFTEHKFMGVMVELDAATRPDFHRKQNGDDCRALVFGAEIEPIEFHNGINWTQVLTIQKRLSPVLCKGEEKQLTPAQIAKVNAALEQMIRLSLDVYNELELARNLFKTI